MTNHITYRIFIGCLLTSEIRMHLNQSKIWHQISILPSNNEKELVEVHHDSKDYFGYYLNEKISLQTLTETSQSIRDRLHIYFPKYDMQSLKICIFPQVFIA